MEFRNLAKKLDVGRRMQGTDESGRRVARLRGPHDGKPLVREVSEGFDEQIEALLVGEATHREPGFADPPKSVG